MWHWDEYWHFVTLRWVLTLCDTEMSYYGAGVSHWPGLSVRHSWYWFVSGWTRAVPTSVHWPLVHTITHHARFRSNSPVSTLWSAACIVWYQANTPQWQIMFSCCCRGQKETKKRKKSGGVVLGDCPSSPAYEPSLVFTPHSPIFTIQSNNVQSSSLSSEDFYYYQATNIIIYASNIQISLLYII